MQYDIPKIIDHPTVTFDWDDTLTLPAYHFPTRTWVASGKPNRFIMAELCRLVCEGWKAIIITERDKSKINEGRLSSFIAKYELPVAGQIFTAGHEKNAFIKAAKAILHYDDDLYELETLPEDCSGILVEHPSDYLTDEDYEMAHAAHAS